MPLVRPYDGPDPGHPIRVVPAEPGRRGGLVRVRGWEVAVADPVEEITDLATLVAAAEAVGWSAPDRPADLPPFTGGLLGLITDDVSAGLLGLPADDDRPTPAPLPPVWFGRYGGAACRDPGGRWWLVGQGTRDVAAAEALLRRAAPARGRPPSTAHVTGTPRQRRFGVHVGEAVRTTIDRAAHADAVRRIQSWIADGDVYQVNLTLHLAAPWTGSARALAWRLFGASDHAAHAAFLHAPGGTVASVSPETFLRIDGRRAAVRPIKGTRRRHADPQRDAALAADLRSAAKDAAEHVMIVDLERNDLGRISRVGTVRVPELMALEPHPTVWHLTSTVTGELQPQRSFADVLAALFPCGSVTGAPKRMAVARTRLVEPWRRGVYCGAIGVVGEGLVDLSVAIRTAVLHDGTAWYGAGGGIVADSDPDAEWDEVMAKAAAFLVATGTTAPDGRTGRTAATGR